MLVLNILILYIGIFIFNPYSDFSDNVTLYLSPSILYQNKYNGFNKKF